MAELPPRSETIPDLVAMGMVGFSRPGETSAEVHFFDDELPESEEFIFCEGFATDAQGRRYCWEVWTVEEYERCSADPSRNQIARGEIAGQPETRVRIAEVDDGVFVWRQVLVERAAFDAAFVERLRLAPPIQRGWFFTEMPPDDDAGDRP
jgi:hypothetical protein